MKKVPSPRVRIVVEREVSTYAELWHGAKILHDKAESDPSGSHYVFMSALVLYAFTIEAYCNAVGPDLFGTAWSDGEDAIERKSPLGKLALISAAVKVPVARGCRPWQTFAMLFRVRNHLAHGKIISVKREDVTAHVPGRHDYLGNVWLAAPWDEFSTKEHVDRARSDIGSFLKIIHDQLPFETMRLFSFGGGTGSAIVERDAS
jgi:hypothetical protein